MTIDGLDPIPLSGGLLSPTAMSMPAMARVVPKKKRTLAKQRKEFARAKAAKKVAEGRVLATLLWDAAKAAGDDATKQALWAEAQIVLTEARAAAGEDIDPITLQMLFTIERWLHKDTESLAAAAEVLQRFPDSQSATALAPWVGFLQLTLWRNAEAAALVESWEPATLATNPHLPYVAAWSAFRRGDFDTARGLIIDAARAWKSDRTRPAVQAEVVTILARSGATLDEAAGIVRELAGDETAVHYMLAYRLYEAYDATGHAADAAGALDIALGLDAPPTDRVLLLVRQGTSLLVAGKHTEVAGKMRAALEAVTACGEPCAGQDAGIVAQVGKLASHMHTIYSTTQDEGYYTTAKALYDLYLDSGAEDIATYQGYLQGLEDTKANMMPGSGTHDAKVVDTVLKWRSSVALACYEQQLQAEPSLAGTIGLGLVVGEDGRVSEVAGDFPDDSPGLKAAVDCLTDRAQQWVFPSRSSKGTTTIKVTYEAAPHSVQ